MVLNETEAILDFTSSSGGMKNPSTVGNVYATRVDLPSPLPLGMCSRISSKISGGRAVKPFIGIRGERGDRNSSTHPLP